MSGHHATLLRGTVEALLPEHDVYITDWLDARRIPLSRGKFDLDDYIAYVIEFLQVLGPETHVLAVCQPTVPVLAAVSLMAQADDPNQPRSMVLMGGPIDAEAAPTAVTKLAKGRPLSWFERTVVSQVPVYYPGALRRVYPGFVQLTGFMSMNLDRHVGEHLRLFEHLVQGDGESAGAHRRFYDEYLSVMDLPAEFYLQTVSTVFQHCALPNGTMRWRGEPVDPSAIRRTALMTVEGEMDDISAPGQTRAAHRLVSNLPEEMQADHMQPGVGHYGIFNGRRWRGEIQPAIAAFVRKQARHANENAA
jgi:poly(3-hydroxybutyrate) depolymerase